MNRSLHACMARRPLLIATALSMTLLACAGERPSASPASSTSTTSGHQCDLELGMCKAELDPATPPACTSPPCLPPDQTTLAERSAGRVFARMQADLTKCYSQREHAQPDPDFLTVDVTINPDGSVKKTKTEGGASLGERATRCVEDRVKREKFDPPYGGGTLLIHQPLTLRTAGPIAAAK